MSGGMAEGVVGGRVGRLAAGGAGSDEVEAGGECEKRSVCEGVGEVGGAGGWFCGDWELEEGGGGGRGGGGDGGWPGSSGGRGDRGGGGSTGRGGAG